MSARLSADMPCNEPGDAGRCMGNVSCVIVSYRPEVAQLVSLCEQILVDGARVIVVDNTEVPDLTLDGLPAGCELITLGTNSGIAHAQNVGVAQALNASATVIVFFDQDSEDRGGVSTGAGDAPEVRYSRDYIPALCG